MTRTFTPAVVREWLAAEESRLRRAIDELDPVGLADHSAEEDLGEVASGSQHPADVASETFEREVEFGLLEDFHAALVDVGAARARLEAGTYGICERCREPIAHERLEAVPATRFCRTCADVAERMAARDFAGRRRVGVLVDPDEFLAHDDELDDGGRELSELH
jgi:RNA polymerase-binding transcription factor DksA